MQKKERLYIIFYTKIKYLIKEYTWKNKHFFLVQYAIKMYKKV